MTTTTLERTFVCPSCLTETTDVGIRKDGYFEPYCRPCNRERCRAYYAKNKTKVKAAVRTYVATHPEVRRAAQRRYDQKPEVQARHADREQARKIKTKVVLDRAVIFVLNGGVCGLCLMEVDPERWDVDHIVPLARGGIHSYVNTQPAHPLCNQIKGARHGF